MALADIAEGVRVVETQNHRDVAVVDAAGGSLADRLEPCASALPCSLAVAARLARRFAAGASVERSAEAADVTRTVAAKTLHLLGFVGVVTVDPADRAVVRRWIDGEIDRTAARRRTDLEAERFALTAYVETHDPLPAGRAALEPGLATTDDVVSDQQRALEETMSDPTDLPTGMDSAVGSRR